MSHLNKASNSCQTIDNILILSFVLHINNITKTLFLNLCNTGKVRPDAENLVHASMLDYNSVLGSPIIYY